MHLNELTPLTDLKHKFQVVDVVGEYQFDSEVYCAYGGRDLTEHGHPHLNGYLSRSLCGKLLWVRWH